MPGPLSLGYSGRTTCHSGSHTGDPRLDEALCEVVALRLEANGLRGSVLDLQAWLCGLSQLSDLRISDNDDLEGAVLPPGDGAGCMPSLTAVILAGNRLGGELPQWLLEAPLLSELDLSGNRFTTPQLWLADTVDVPNATLLQTEQAGAPSPTLSLLRSGRLSSERGGIADGLIIRCYSDGAVTCAGLPPQSCHAFGPDYKIRTDDPRRCSYCNPQLIPGAIAALLIAVLLLLIILAICRPLHLPSPPTSHSCLYAALDGPSLAHVAHGMWTSISHPPAPPAPPSAPTSSNVLPTPL